VQELIQNLILEVVKNYDVAGIQVYDYFGMSVQFSYDTYTYTVKLYQKEHLGKNPRDEPFAAEWMRWRANGIADFMVRISQAVKAIKPHLKISLFPNFQYYAYKYYLQD
jgi:uncharacterized lipoprotein YddW (UPF0748 family)